MTQDIIQRLRSIAAAGPSRTRTALEGIFPEYASLGKGKAKTENVFRARTSILDDTPDQTTPRTFRSRKTVLPSPSSPAEQIDPFTLSSLLRVPHLAELATLVVDSQARREERTRLRRLRDDLARPPDLTIESGRRTHSTDPKHWKLTDVERRRKMERLVEWVIRAVAEEGSLVQLTLSAGYGYLPLPPQLLFPLLIPHLEAEKSARQKVFLRNTDPRRDNGMTVAELVGRLRGWGEEGRWERVGQWKVEEAIEWAEERGLWKRAGSGWWVAQGEG